MKDWINKIKCIDLASWYWAALFLGCCHLTSSESQAQSLLKEKLWKGGFEQVYIEEQGDTLRLSFEHRGIRSPGHALEYMTLLLAEDLGDRKLLVYPRYHQVVLGQYEVGKGSWSAVPKDLGQRMKSGTDLAKDYRLHFTLVPDFSARFGYYDQPVQEKTNLILSSQLFLLPGLSIQSGILLPISNTLDNQEKNIRIAPSNIRYVHAWKQRNLLSVSAGMYYANRYGMVAEYRRMDFNKNFSFGAELSYTGFYFLPSSGIYRTELDELVVLADVEYRLPFEPMVSLKLSGGQFLFRDRGVRMDFIRQYGAVDVGFFAAKTEAGFNGGFQFAFPLFPGKILRTQKVELRTTEEFRWEYGYNNEEVVGRSFRLGYPKLSDWSRQYHRSVIDADF